jgi:hypothetical protein
MCAPAIASAQTVPADYQSVLSALGKQGDYKDNVLKVNIPRNDLKVVLDGVATPTPFGFGGWIALTKGTGGMDVMMGDLVLTEDEVNPVMSALLTNGLDVTALHNHFFFDQPRIYFMHIGGMGDTSRLASAVKAVYDRVAQVRSAQASPSTAFPGDIAATSSISAAAIEEVFGTKAQASNGMVKIVIGRKATMHGVEVGNEMGVNTWAAFAGSDRQAVVDGDFAMLESELQTVLKTMRADGINIVAIHQHMTQETPRYVFLHYWGKGSAVDLAKAVKRAVDTQKL